LFERGFKTWCEKYAVEKRLELGLPAHAPLDAFKLAKNLGVKVWTPRDVPNLNPEAVEILLRNDGTTPSCWSAVTIVVNHRILVILNSSHSPGRQSSDLTHELAHHIRGHKAQEVSVTEEGLMMLKSYEKIYEEEADWLSGCLMLPRDALVDIKRRGVELGEAAEEYGVSLRMLNYRISMTGVNRQFQSRA